MDKFSGIRIEATGQNIIAVGDGNQINAQHSDIAHALIDLRKAVIASEKLNDAQKLDAASDIDSIGSQLVKATPNKTVISAAWERVKKIGTAADIALKVGKVAALLAPLLG